MVAAHLVVERKIRPHGSSLDVRARAGDVPHVAVLTGRDDAVELVPRELGRVNARGCVFALRPFGECALDREHVREHAVGMLRVEAGRNVLAVARPLDVHGIAHVVAGAAERGAPVEGGSGHRMLGHSVGEGTASRLRRVGHKLAVRRGMRNRVKRGEDRLVFRRARSRLVVGIDHAVAEVALNALPVVGGDHAASGVERTSAEPAGRRMASQAQISYRRRVLLGDGETREKEGIAHRVGHHAAPPVEPRLDVRVVVSVAGCAFGVRVAEEARVVRL